MLHLGLHHCLPLLHCHEEQARWVLHSQGYWDEKFSPLWEFSGSRHWDPLASAAAGQALSLFVVVDCSSSLDAVQHVGNAGWALEPVSVAWEVEMSPSFDSFAVPVESAGVVAALIGAAVVGTRTDYMELDVVDNTFRCAIEVAVNIFEQHLGGALVTMSRMQASLTVGCGIQDMVDAAAYGRLPS